MQTWQRPDTTEPFEREHNAEECHVDGR